MKKLSMEIECGTCSERVALNLVNLAAAVHNLTPRPIDDIADLVHRFGFAAYVGSNHVAVHIATANGEIDPASPERFAIITEGK